jgi:hypothetical protein
VANKIYEQKTNWREKREKATCKYAASSTALPTTQEDG